MGGWWSNTGDRERTTGKDRVEKDCLGMNGKSFGKKEKEKYI
jgi:hypothetical protein